MSPADRVTPGDVGEIVLDAVDLILIAELVVNAERLELTPRSRDALGTVLRVARDHMGRVSDGLAALDGARR